MNQRFHPLAVVLALAGAILFFVSSGLAAEVQLAGIRLNDPVMNLITRAGWGLPEGIGPIAQTGAAPASARAGGATTASASREVAPLPVETVPSRTGTNRLGRPGGTIASPAQQKAGASAAADKGELRGTAGLQYWLYSKSNGLRIVIGVEPAGNIATINVQGPPNNQVRTSRGIGLGSSYFDLINFYGYPEASQPIAGGLRVNYADQDVTFQLQNLQVTEITIGTPPAAAAPAPASQTRATPASQTRATPGDARFRMQPLQR
jgi:hypothetical protein